MAIESVSNELITAKGTKIMKPGNDMDKNAFLRILVAELSNQDPTNTKDSTQYVAQMAQFTSLEQMTNLNSVMTMNSASSMIGKQVTLNSVDTLGNQYTGIVRSVSKLSGNTKVSVEINNNGNSELKNFAYEDINGVTDIINDNTEIPTDSAEDNTRFLEASTMIGMKAEFDVKDAAGSNYAGIVMGVTRDGSDIKLSVITTSGSAAQEFSMDKIIKLYGY